MTKTQTKADINFEQELWKAANELRGAVAENQYKDYILPLIFLKHVSERYELRRDGLKSLLQDPNRIIIRRIAKNKIMSLKTQMSTCLKTPISFQKKPLGNFCKIMRNKTI